MVTIASFSLPIDAQIPRAKLESEGIPAFIADEHTINMQWLYSDAMGGVRLQVPESCATRARELLEQIDVEEVIDQNNIEVPHCPRCNSTQLEAVTEGKRMAFLAFLLINFPLWPFRRKLRCRSCGEIVID